jgi:UDP-N-acetylmuramate dehydrogenase
VLGGGSNIVISDAGIDGVVLRIAQRGITLQERGDTVLLDAAAGEPWDDFVAYAVERNLQGIECLSGIPGLVGATPIQNVGAYGQEVSETIESVRVLDRETLAVEERGASDCGFAYRDSFFKSTAPNRYVVLGVRFRLRRGAPPKVQYAELAKHFAGSTSPTLPAVRDAVVELRRQKSMVLDATDPNRRSCGSFFVNALLEPGDLERITARVGAPPPHFPQPDGRLKVPSAWLIERAGLAKGTRRGSVGLSTKHTLAVVAHDGARASDVLDFAAHVRATVQAAFGVKLVPEPEFWGFSEYDERLPVAL